MSFSKLLNTQEVANLLGVKVNTLSVWRCAKRYDLPFVKAGRLVRYRPEDVENFVARRTQNAGRHDA